MTLVEQITRDEGVRLKPYRDSVGKLTIGIGRNLDDKGISLAEAQIFLQDDIRDVQAELQKALPWVYHLDDARRGVLENMAYNMGVEKLLSFHDTLSFVQRGLFAQAANAMMQSKWAVQVGARAVRLAEQMRTGVWQ
jgi:lysozyme